MSETMKLLGSYKNKITKDKNGENVPHLKITAVVLAHCNIASNDCMYICLRKTENYWWPNINIIIEYQKTINLLDNAPNQPFKFSTKCWVEINYDHHRKNNTNIQIKFNAIMLNSSLCE